MATQTLDITVDRTADGQPLAVRMNGEVFDPLAAVDVLIAGAKALESEAAALREERDEIDEQWTTWAADLAKRIDPHNEHGDLEAGQVIESAVNEVGALRAEVARLRDILAVLYRDDVDAAEARADLAQRRVEELEGAVREAKRLLREVATLDSNFGDEWRDYCDQVRALLTGEKS